MAAKDEAKDDAGGRVLQFPGMEQQAERGQVHRRLQEVPGMVTGYANGFRTSAMAEEVMLDMGMNEVIPAPVPDGPPAVLLKVGQRVIMNYPTAKRLAIAMGRLIRQHEEQFGEIPLGSPSGGGGL